MVKIGVAAARPLAFLADVLPSSLAAFLAATPTFRAPASMRPLPVFLKRISAKKYQIAALGILY
jgi:hypothetical protein